MLIAVPDCESETYTKIRCNNDQESVTLKSSKVLGSVRSDRFHGAFFWMPLDGNREPRLTSKNGRNVLSVYMRFFHFFVCLGSL
jgi:hypothetical protein